MNKQQITSAKPQKRDNNKYHKNKSIKNIITVKQKFVKLCHFLLSQKQFIEFNLLNKETVAN